MEENMESRLRLETIKARRPFEQPGQYRHQAIAGGGRSDEAIQNVERSKPNSLQTVLALALNDLP